MGRRNLWGCIIVIGGLALFVTPQRGLAAKAPGKKPSAAQKRPVKTAPEDGTAQSKSREQPLRPPVDINDERACLRELAELANFPLFLSDAGAYQPNMFGGYFQRLDEMDFDRAIRFDRLQECKSQELRVIAERVYRIWVDASRLNRLEQHFGMNPDVVMGEVKKIHYALFDVADSALADQETGWETRVRDGKLIQVPITRNRESNRTREKEADLFGKTLDLFASAHTRMHTTRAAGVCRALMWQNLATIWKEELLPRFEAIAGPEAEKPLLKLSDIPATLKKTRDLPFGIVRCSNPTAEPLQDVLLSVVTIDNAGERTEWFAYLRTLEPHATCLTFLPDTYTRDGLSMYAEGFTFSASLISTNGKCGPIEFKLTRAKPKPGDRAAQAKRVNGKAQTVKEQKAHAAERYQTLKRGMSELVEEAPVLLSLAARLVPPPQNPQRVQTRLLASTTPDKKYAGKCSFDGKEVPVSVEFRPYDHTIGMVTMDVTYQWSTGDKRFSTYCWLQPERDRGCVITSLDFKVICPELQIQLFEESLTKAEAAKNESSAARLREEIATIRSARAETVAERDARGKVSFMRATRDITNDEYRFLTSPEDIESGSGSMPGISGLGGMMLLLNDLQRSAAKREILTRDADFVFSCDPLGRATLQILVRVSDPAPHVVVKLISLEAGK